MDQSGLVELAPLPPVHNQPRASPWFRVAYDWARLVAGGEAKPGVYYDLLGDKVLARSLETPLVNMGFWRGTAGQAPASLPAATDALFSLVDGSADMGPKDSVLDAGCGFGTNAVHAVRHHGAREVTGLNLSRVQLASARRRAMDAGLGDRLRFVEGSATAMPFHDGAFDKVVSIEAAFHFDSRREFFAEARRVLRPGGILSMADIVAAPPRNFLMSALLWYARRGLQMPASNIEGIDAYRQALESAGFEVLEVENITPDVVGPFRRWFFTQPLRDMLGFHPAYMAVSAAFFFYPWQYVRVKARVK
jgi:cyclopropane fatty-acyl-phospholipid synthase-like methyltransferase